MRRFLLVVVILAVAAPAAWWLIAPRPGASAFENHPPRALRKTWAIAANPGSPNIALVDPNGAIQPRARSYSVHFFVYDRDSRKLYSPLLGNVRAHTKSFDGRSHKIAWEAEGVRYVQDVAATADRCYARVVVRNLGGEGRRISVFAAAVPRKVIGSMQTRYDVACDGRAIVVDGKVLLASERMPEDVGATEGRTGKDVTSYFAKGALPGAKSAGARLDGSSSAAMRFDVRLQPKKGSELRFVMPMNEVPPGQPGRLQGDEVEQAFADARGTWDERLGRVKLSVPDRRVTDCWRASAAYLVMLCGDGVPKPGPARYRAFWVRDAAYMADALFYAGQQELIPPALAELRRMQLPSGGFSPKTGGGEEELDSPGQAVYTWVMQYRRTGDRRFLDEHWPAIAKACRYLRDRRDASGILPASLSAEDLGRSDQQHYWDDFWAVRGLRDAAVAARELDKSSDAAWMQAEADSLLRATLASARSLNIDYIPNGPQELTSSAMARGTSCALWPCDVLDLDDPLTKRSFDVYWEKWIAPYGGGFVHKDHFWPYAGMDLAQGYVMLGQRERAWQMLDWTLKSDPTRGFYSWPEGMFRDDLTLAEGDMPHGWMCAAYVSMVRNMLVRESRGELVLLSGVPGEWLKPEKSISVRRFPTEFGGVSFRVEVSGSELKLTFADKPNVICRVVLPGNRVVLVPRDARVVRVGL